MSEGGGLQGCGLVVVVCLPAFCVFGGFLWILAEEGRVVEALTLAAVIAGAVLVARGKA